MSKFESYNSWQRNQLQNKIASYCGLRKSAYGERPLPKNPERIVSIPIHLRPEPNSTYAQNGLDRNGMKVSEPKQGAKPAHWSKAFGTDYITWSDGSMTYAPQAMPEPTPPPAPIQTAPVPTTNTTQAAVDGFVQGLGDGATLVEQSAANNFVPVFNKATNFVQNTADIFGYGREAGEFLAPGREAAANWQQEANAKQLSPDLSQDTVDMARSLTDAGANFIAGEADPTSLIKVPGQKQLDRIGNIASNAAKVAPDGAVKNTLQDASNLNASNAAQSFMTRTPDGVKQPQQTRQPKSQPEPYQATFGMPDLSKLFNFNNNRFNKASEI